MINKTMAIGIGAMLIIVSISALMIPISAEFSNNVYSYTSNGENQSYSLIETDRDVELITTNGVGYINGEPVTEFTSGSTILLMFGDTFVIRYSGNSGAIALLTSTGNVGITEILFSDGEYTATTETGTITGTYGYLMKWAKNGDYVTYSNMIGKKVDADATVYIAQATTSSESYANGVWKGTINNIQKEYDYLNEADPFTIESEISATNPDVYEITNSTYESTVRMFIPQDYKIVTSTDSMIRMIISLMPLFVGVAGFAAMGITLTRLTKI